MAEDPVVREEQSEAPGTDAEPVHDVVLRFFTERFEGSGSAIFRIGFGLLAIWTAFGALLNFDRYFANDGMIPWRLVGHWDWANWSLIALDPENDAWAFTLVVAFLVASVTMTVGLFSRTSAFFILVVNLSLQHRNPYILNSGDRLFMILAGLAIFLPLARRWSVEAWWRVRRGAPLGPPPSIWSTRVMQMQICYVYWFSCFAKLNNERWLEGRALRDVLSSPIYAEWAGYIDFWPIVYALTWGTILLEFLWPSLVWFKNYRPYVLVSGVLFHVGIDVLMLIPMFSYVMIVSYAVFLTDDEVDWVIRRFRKRTAPGPDTLQARRRGAA